MRSEPDRGEELIYFILIFFYLIDPASLIPTSRAAKAAHPWRIFGASRVPLRPSLV
jgi:hypothetical protein